MTSPFYCLQSLMPFPNRSAETGIATQMPKKYKIIRFGVAMTKNGGSVVKALDH